MQMQTLAKVFLKSDILVLQFVALQKKVSHLFQYVNYCVFVVLCEIH